MIINKSKANEQQEATIEETSLDTEIEIITSNDNDSMINNKIKEYRKQN